MSTVYPNGHKEPGFPTNAYFTRLVQEGQTSVKDLRSGKMTCIILLPSGRHCGAHMILQGGGDGWDTPNAKPMAEGTSFYNGKDASFGEAHWRCPKKHTVVPEATVGAEPRVMSVAERQALDEIARRVQDPEKGTVLGEVEAPKGATKEAAVEIKVKGEGLSFDLSLEDLTSETLVNDLLQKISSALEDVPTPTMKVAKKVMAIQEKVDSLKK